MINAADKANDAKGETWHQLSIINFAFHSILYQYGSGSCLTYELTFADCSDVIKASNPDASYTISNISLEFHTVIYASWLVK